MKKLLIGAAAAVAIAAPGVASADTNAVVGVHYGNTDYGPGDWDSYGISGAFSHDFTNGWFLQAEGDQSRADVGTADLSQGYGAIHYGTRNDTFAFGGFVSFEEFFALSGTGVGIEGQWNLNNLVLGGSLGQVDYDLFSIVALQADAKYFITPNFSVNALVSQNDADEFDTDWTAYGVGAEYRFHGPVSVSANWRTDDFDYGEAESFSIGLTFDLGAGSLFERQTSGPSLQGARNLHGAAGNLSPVT